MKYKTGSTSVYHCAGSVIDQEALVDALNTQEIGAAALDVTDPEPLPRDHPLLKVNQEKSL